MHHCESGELLARAEQVMVLIDRAARQPTPVPERLARRRGGLRGQPREPSPTQRAGDRRRRRGGRRDPARVAGRAARGRGRALERDRVRRGARRWWSARSWARRPGGVPEPALAVPIVYRGDTVAALWFGSEPPRAARAELDARGGAARALLPRRLGHRRRAVGPVDAGRYRALVRMRGRAAASRFAAARRSGARGRAGSSMPMNLKSKSSPAAVSKSTRPTLSMRSSSSGRS